MSKTIWKYRLPRDGQTIEIHEHIVEVLHIGAQDGVPCLWAVVDPQRPRDGYTEVVAWGTGWPLPDDVYAECDYWGSCVDGAGYVWHYFAAARFPERVYTEDFVNRYETIPGLLYTMKPEDMTVGKTISIGDTISAGNTLVLSCDGLSIDWDQLNKLASTTTTDLGSVTATTCAYL